MDFNAFVLYYRYFLADIGRQKEGINVIFMFECLFIGFNNNIKWCSDLDS